MNSYFFLGGAIFFEVCGTLLLPATHNFSRLVPTGLMMACYGIAFYCLTFAIRDIPIALAYAIWSGAGVFLIALFSTFVYRQILEWPAILGLGFIISGVVLVNIFSFSDYG